MHFHRMISMPLQSGIIYITGMGRQLVNVRKEHVAEWDKQPAMVGVYIYIYIYILYLGWAVCKVIVYIHRTPMCMHAFCVYVSAIEQRRQLAKLVLATIGVSCGKAHYYNIVNGLVSMFQTLLSARLLIHQNEISRKHIHGLGDCVAGQFPRCKWCDVISQ